LSLILLRNRLLLLLLLLELRILLNRLLILLVKLILGELLEILHLHRVLLAQHWEGVVILGKLLVLHSRGLVLENIPLLLTHVINYLILLFNNNNFIHYFSNLTP
jgi:hypothetical protein